MIPLREDLENLINKNMTRLDIVAIYNKKESTVSNWFKKYGLKSKLIGGARNVKNLIGEKFGRLLVMDLYQIGSHGKEYICKCDCGNTTIQRGSSLTSRAVVSCGCNKNEKAVNNAYILSSNRDFDIYHEQKEIIAKNKIGESYNDLTIINVEYNSKNNNFYYICKCKCGNITTQRYADLINGKVKSCGCYQKEQASKTGSNIGLNNYKNKYDWYFIKDNKKIKCRSGFEVIYANYLIKNKIKFEYEPESFKLDNGRRYTPDFYLVDENKYIEIKGSFKINEKYSHQKENIDMFKENNDWKILYWEDIVLQCGLPLKTYHSYLRRARKLNIKEEDYLANIMY